MQPVPVFVPAVVATSPTLGRDLWVGGFSASPFFSRGEPMTNLILTRRAGESILVGDDIEIILLESHGTGAPEHPARGAQTAWRADTAHAHHSPQAAAVAVTFVRSIARGWRRTPFALSELHRLHHEPGIQACTSSSRPTPCPASPPRGPGPSAFAQHVNCAGNVQERAPTVARR